MMWFGIPKPGHVQRAPTGEASQDQTNVADSKPAQVLRIQLDGGNPSATAAGEETQPGTSNYFIGNDPEHWRTNVANYGKVRYQGVYDGVDLVYYGNQRKLEYDFIVQPGADYKQIRLNIQGADNVSIDDDGNLVLHMKDGDVVQHKPVVYQTETDDFAGTVREPPLRGFDRKTPTGKYVILADAGGTVCLECGDASPPLQSADESAHSKTKTGAANGAPTGTLVGFEVDNYDPSKPLVIDPVLSYSTYLGGSGEDVGYDIAADSSGNAYITGWTSSSNFPTTAGAYQTAYGGGIYDAFVSKLSLEATTSTTTTVTSSLNPSTSGAAVTFTASVSGSGGTPTGTVTFKDGSTTLGTGTLSSGQTTYRTSSLSVGTHSITAVYGGDSAFAASTSSVLTQTTTTATTATSVTSSANPSAYGAAVTFTATVTGSGTTTPTGTVTFMDGSTTLGTGTLSNGSATYTTSTLSAGTHSITAVYGGDTSYTGSTSSILTQTVSRSINATTTSVTSSANPSAYGASVTFTATVCCNGIISPTGTVTFKSGTTTLGTGMLSGSNTQATYTTSALIAGAHPITAVYGGNTNFAGSTSPILTQTVTNTPGVSNYSGTYSGQGVTIHLTQSSTTLSGTFSAGNINGNLGGFVDSSDRAYTWAWWDSPGSGVVAGSLGVSENPFSGSQRTFSFGGGQSTDGRIGEIILSGMRQASLSGSTTRTRGSGIANYAGTYSGQGVTITLTQSSETLSGAFIAGNVSGTMGGFVDSSSRAYVWAWWDSSSIGSGVVAGNLTVTTTSTPPTTPNLPTASDTSASQATFSFGGGQSSGGRIDEIILRGMTRQ